MRKSIILSVLIFTLFFTFGCSNQEKSFNKKQSNDTKTPIVQKTKNLDRIDEYISAECSWAFDVTDPQLILENTDYFVKARIKTKEKTKYFIKNTIMPNSTYNVEILEVISPENVSLPKNIKIAVQGGIVSMEEYVNTLDPITKQKTNTDKLSKNDMKKQILISNEAYYELEQGNEYCIFIRDLTQDNDYKGYYGVPDGGYDVFLEEDGMYINVLTQQVFIR